MNMGNLIFISKFKVPIIYTINRQGLTKISVQALFQWNDLKPQAIIGYEMIDSQQGTYH